MVWPQAGPENTLGTLKIAVEAAGRHGIRHLVIASNSGATVRKALEIGAGDISVVCVTHHVGFSGPGVDEMPQEVRRDLTSRGVKVLTTTHVLAGVDRSLRFKFGGVYPPEIIAGALRMLGQGLKVCVEISIMALDAGIVPYGERIVAVGGTSSGADTAAIIVPEHSNNVFGLKVEEILCKPRTW
ncbi:MAG: pyruvate kinase alpha/beta domain-containing protein [Bacillota bacterium]|nr:pyruvate kinase alpha/beta domain-containing protein [Bacillota bacterium]